VARQEAPAVIRIQLVAMDTMLSDMITDLLAREPDIAVVGRANTVGQAMDLASAEPTDVLLLQEQRASEGLMAAALAPRPPAILCIAANGRRGWTLHIDAECNPIEAAEGGLAAAVRRVAARLM
jgi:DNA-binding NarL/FixJ family response regulator